VRNLVFTRIDLPSVLAHCDLFSLAAGIASFSPPLLAASFDHWPVDKDVN
jgi:hypothetical protein